MPAASPVDSTSIRPQTEVTRSSSSERPSQTGQDWIELVRQNGTPVFSAAFATDAFLEASVLDGVLVGVNAIGAFFRATSSMYDTIAFTHETRIHGKTFLEWSGRVFGEDVGGATIVTRDENGLIASVRLYHRPLSIVKRFSAELASRLEGKVDPSVFDRSK